MGYFHIYFLLKPIIISHILAPKFWSILSTLSLMVAPTFKSEFCEMISSNYAPKSLIPPTAASCCSNFLHLPDCYILRTIFIPSTASSAPTLYTT